MTNETEALIVRYDVTDAAIAELAEANKDADASTPDGYRGVVQGIASTRALRVSVEATRKDLKKDALAYGRRVDGEAKRITAALLEIEQPLKELKAGVDDEKARVKREAAEAKLEAQRVELEAMKAERDAVIAAERKEIDEERARLAEERRQIEITREALAAEEKAHDDLVRIEREMSEAADLEAEREESRKANMPDARKLKDYAGSLVLLSETASQYMNLTTDPGRRILGIMKGKAQDIMNDALAFEEECKS